jgi:hypothetical protein
LPVNISRSSSRSPRRTGLVFAALSKSAASQSFTFDAADGYTRRLL